MFLPLRGIFVAIRDFVVTSLGPRGAGMRGNFVSLYVGFIRNSRCGNESKQKGARCYTRIAPSPIERQAGNGGGGSARFWLPSTSRNREGAF
jgi:hypothetical protein